MGDPRTDFVIFTGFHESGLRVACRPPLPTTHQSRSSSAANATTWSSTTQTVNARSTACSEGIFGECGQMCIAGSRLLVQDSIYDEFVAELVDLTSALRVGDPFDPEVQVGPQTTAAQRDKTRAMIDRAKEDGAVVAAEAPLPNDERLTGGYFVAPTVFVDVAPQMEIMREEVLVEYWRSRDSLTSQTQSKSRTTKFGLSAGVWTTSAARAHRVAAELRAGTVWINTYAVISDLVPFGGIGQSGWGREGGSEAAHLYTRTKSVWLSLDDQSPARLNF